LYLLEKQRLSCEV